MHYIVFDLEFNQDFPSQSGDGTAAWPKKINEIIQIGAVKLDDDLQTIGTFEREIQQHLKKLIVFRKNSEAICWGSLVTLYADRYVYAYLREFIGNTVIVVMNNGHDPMMAPLTIHIGDNANIPLRVKDNLEKTRITSLFEGFEPIDIQNGRFSIKLPGKTAVIFYCK